MDLKHEEKTDCLCFGLAVSLLFPSRAPKALTSCVWALPQPCQLCSLLGQRALCGTAWSWCAHAGEQP